MVKLCDWGGIGHISKDCSEFKLGTLVYSAPEVIETVKYDTGRATL